MNAEERSEEAGNEDINLIDDIIDEIEDVKVMKECFKEWED